MNFASMTKLSGFLVLGVSSAIAQTPAPIQPAPAPTAVAGIPNWLWILLAVLLAGAAVWYVIRARRKP